MSFESHEKTIRCLLASAWQLDEPREKLVGRFHRYYLACARRIFPLLPHEESRTGVEIAEKYLDGSANQQEVWDQNWLTEGAAFTFDYDSEPDRIASWMTEVEAIPEKKISFLLNGCYEANTFDAREILGNAAYFADGAMIFPWCTHLETVHKREIPFLSVDLFQRYFPDKS